MTLKNNNNKMQVLFVKLDYSLDTERKGLGEHI